MPLASLPIIQAEGYKLMVDTGCYDLGQLVFPIFPPGHPEPPESLSVLGQPVDLSQSPRKEAWRYADHRPMFNDPRVGEGQQFDFLLTLGWCHKKTISFTRNGVKVNAV